VQAVASGVLDAGDLMEIRMDTLLDTLIRFYELKGRETVVANTAAAPTDVVDPASHDASTFPYLP
jgi:hypothetical protein